jgi:predicted nucleic acid-binding protein
VPSGLKNESPLVFFSKIGGLPILARAFHLFFTPEYLKKEMRVV